MVPNEAYRCREMDFIDFFADGSYYESDYYSNNGNSCVDSNIEDKGKWSIPNNILKREITWGDNDNREEIDENITKLDLNNLIISESQPG